MPVTDAVVAIAVVCLIFGLPMLGLTLRLSLKPLVEAYARMKEATVRPPTSSELEALKMRVAALEAIWEDRLGAGTLEPSSPRPSTPVRS